MADAPYLIALALCCFDGQRALPLAGRSQGAEALAAVDPGVAGERLALELLLRVWQRSDAGALQRAAAEPSLLLLEMPLELLSEQLPLIKRAWLQGGSTEACLEALAELSQRGWTIAVAPYEPIRFKPWPSPQGLS